MTTLPKIACELQLQVTITVKGQAELGVYLHGSGVVRHIQENRPAKRYGASVDFRLDSEMHVY